MKEFKIFESKGGYYEYKGLIKPVPVETEICT